MNLRHRHHFVAGKDGCQHPDCPIHAKKECTCPKETNEDGLKMYTKINCPVHGINRAKKESCTCPKDEPNMVTFGCPIHDPETTITKTKTKNTFRAEFRAKKEPTPKKPKYVENWQCGECGAGMFVLYSNLPKRDKDKTPVKVGKDSDKEAVERRLNEVVNDSLKNGAPRIVDHGGEIADALEGKDSDTREEVATVRIIKNKEGWFFGFDKPTAKKAWSLFDEYIDYRISEEVQRARISELEWVVDQLESDDTENLERYMNRLDEAIEDRLKRLRDED